MTSLLIFFLGIPAALVAWAFWSVLVGTSSPSGSPRVTGWRAVLYDLPAYLIIVGAAVASLVFAAKALRARARRARLGLWLSTGGLLFVLAMLATTVADTVVTPSSATLNWAVRAVALVIAAGSMYLARRWARTSPA